MLLPARPAMVNPLSITRGLQLTRSEQLVGGRSFVNLLEEEFLVSLIPEVLL